ncbi:MAG: baseplate J/gp47 family protein [Lawsonibacter sp.]|nr:baseplate J/gp47 family protein [Lawsonibacter sp.]
MKNMDEIYQEMLSCFGERTGLEPREGCDLSARLYALAAQVYALYVQADWVVRQAFPQTAEGEYLDRHAQLRSLERKPAVAAQGVVRFTAGEAAAAPRDIPRGTVCMTTGLVRFETVRDAVLEAGALWADVPVRALEPGSAGNVSAGTIVSMAVAPMGVSACTNPQPCAGGADGETDAALRARVLESFKRLPNGANAAFYQQGALSFDQVAAAAVVSRPRGVGSVDVVPATLAGLPGQELLEQLEDYFQARREIAVDLQVRAPKPVTVNIAVQVECSQGQDQELVLPRVEQTLRDWFTGKLLGQDILRARLGSLIYSCEGVENYAISAPAADVRIQPDVLPILGTLTVEGMA